MNKYTEIKVGAAKQIDSNHMDVEFVVKQRIELSTPDLVIYNSGVRGDVDYRINRARDELRRLLGTPCDHIWMIANPGFEWAQCPRCGTLTCDQAFVDLAKGAT